MKEYWQERLLKIEDLSERRLLRDVLLAAFTNIEDYTNGQLEAIKQRVFEESKLEYDKFNIYTSVVSVNDYDPINDFLFPMNVADLEELPIAAADLTEGLETGEKPTLGKLYFELDYLELREIEKTLSNRRFKGQLKTDSDVYDIEVSLSPFMGYIKQVERLYELYIDNNIPWKTVLHPSIWKFMDMRLETRIAFKKQEKVEEIIIQLEELDVYKQINQVPLWNVKVEPFKNQGFPMPAGDRVNYEHVLMLDEDTRGLEYLIDSCLEVDGVISIRREVDRLILVSSKSVISSWKLWTIFNPLEADLDTTNLLSNRKIESFIDNFASRSGRVVRTVGEVHRLANSFLAATSLRLVDIDLDVEEANFETYELNSFIKDEIRVDGDKKVMKLRFAAGGMMAFTRDIMSFLTSEIGLYFPEYRCVGELV